MRTTITLDDHLLAEAKATAARSGKTLGAFVEDALRETFARRATPRKHVRLPTFRGTGVQPGVDLDNSAALLDLMDRLDAAN